VVFVLCERTDRQTDILITIIRTSPGAKYNGVVRTAMSADVHIVMLSAWMASIQIPRRLISCSSNYRASYFVGYLAPTDNYIMAVGRQRQLPAESDIVSWWHQRVCIVPWTACWCLAVSNATAGVRLRCSVGGRSCIYSCITLGTTWYVPGTATLIASVKYV